MLGDLVKVRYPRRRNLKLASLPAQKLDWSQSILDGNYLRITVEILLRTCSQSTRRIRSRTQKLLLISSPTQFAMFQRQELTLSLNRVIAIEFPNCDPAFSEAAETSVPFITEAQRNHNPWYTQEWEKFLSSFARMIYDLLIYEQQGTIASYIN